MATGLLARLGSASPLLDRDAEQQHPENDLENAHPRSRVALLGCFGAVRDHQDDRPDNGQPGDPGDQERKAVRPRPRRRQHQDDADDRDRAQCDSHPEREDLADCLAHWKQPESTTRPLERRSVGNVGNGN
jgi:hypothetical protein